MTQIPDETEIPGDTDVFRAFRARNKLAQAVRDSLKGRGLDIRERTKELVITNPGQPARGRIYITLASGAASHARTIWDYLGHFEGYGTDRDPDDDPTVDADLIVHTLTHPEHETDTH